MRQNISIILLQFSRSLWLILGLFVVIVILIANYLDSEQQIALSQDLRYQSKLLAEELRQSSDDLTRMVSSYVITGNPIYKLHYQEILDIREGKSPRPINYHDIDWDLVLADDKPPRPYNGQKIALLELIRQAGFSHEELAKLTEAKLNSDVLSNIELAAMKLIESAATPTDVNRIKAFMMVHDDAYLQAKAGIMRSIHDFYQMSEQRTLGAVQAAETRAEHLRSILVIFALLLIFTLWRNYLDLSRVLGAPVQELLGYIARIGSGDFLSAIPVIPGVENSVLGWLSVTQVKLAHLDEQRNKAEQALLITLFALQERSNAVQKSEQLFRSTFEAAPIGVTNFSLDGRLLAVNQGYCQLVGYTQDELLGMSYQQLTAPEYHQLDAEMISKTLLGEIEEFNHEKQYIRKNGERVWSHIWVKLIRNADGLPEYFIGIMQDINVRKRAELELDKTTILLKCILANVPASIFWKDSNLHYLGCNIQCAIDAGYSSPEQMIGKTDFDMSWKDRAELYRADDKLIMASGKPRLNYEEPLTKLNGQLSWILTSKVPLWDDNKQPIGILSVYQDITNSKHNLLELEKFKNIIDCTDDAVISKSPSSIIESWNSGAAKIFGYTAQEAIGKQIQMLIPAAYINEELQIMTRIASGERIGQYETVRLHKDGRLINISTTIFPLLHANGKLTGYSTIARDITERKKAELEMNIAASIFESSEGMVVTDINGTILRVNKAFSSITGYASDDIVGKNPRILKSGRQDAVFYAALWEKVLRTGVWEGEVWNLRKNGEVYPEHLTITAVKDAKGVLTNYVATLSDITLSKESEQEIKYLAYYDPLTRLPNRRLLRDRLKQALISTTRSGLSCGLLFIDLDDFKTLNDTLGHDFGDLLLQQVAERLECSVREGDTVARLGGDEFVVILQNLSKDPVVAASQAAAIGNKILETLNQSYQLGNHKHSNTPSIGATLFNDNMYTIDELMKQADIAMYHSKNSGRNMMRFFDFQMQETINSRASLVVALRKALDNNQLHLYYQIQVGGTQENVSQRVIGAEALIRWIHPERGLISPAEFIPIAEETGVILSIGQWVLDTACAQINTWQQNKQTQALVLAVNISAKQFRQTDFVQQVLSVIQRHAIKPQYLKLELTESLLLEDIDDTIATMNALNKVGVQFSLDDFGTGYSSLQYLKRLPFHQLKIDQSFVRDIAHDSNDRAIVRTIIAMADSLNMNVIAEGVETEQQLQLLFNKGCSHYQGYLFGRPMPIEQFDALVKQSY